MAEETTDAQQPTEAIDTETTPDVPDYDVQVDEAGVLKKKLTITIPQDRIEGKRDEMFGELSHTAQIPGFRVGRAPRRLIEKRFGKEITQDVRNALVGESIGQAIDKSGLKTLGEPDLKLEDIELPESGDLEFSFVVEIAPEFDLPELKDLEVTKSLLGVTDQRIDEEIDNWRQSQARYEPTDEAAEMHDAVTAAATISIEGMEQPVERPGLTLRVAPGQIEGLPLVDLPKALAGKKAGDSASMELTVADAHPNEDWRGKKADVTIQIGQVRRRVLPEMDEAFATSAGFGSLKELRDFVRSRMEVQLQMEVQRSMRQQIEQILLDKISFELPEGVVQRHTVRLIQRRYVDLLQRGVPRERIDERLTEIQAAATEQAHRDLKLQFILDKVAEQHEITVEEGEVNTRIAQMAARYNRRPERLRQELAADGTLNQLEVVLREEKAMDKLLEQAKITEQADEKTAGKKAKPAAKTKKATKKTAKKVAKTSEKKPQKAASAKKAASKKAPKKKTEK